MLIRLSIAAHITGQRFGSLQVRACQSAPTDVKANIIQEEADKQSKPTKRKASSVAGVLESFAASTAAQLSLSLDKVIYPLKGQQHEVSRFKQKKFEPAQVF
jgi:hypothetical protein